MGHPRVRLTVTAETPVAYLSARLCDVFPDGASALAGRGVLNLTHRAGHDAPVALEPGVPTEVEIELEATSWVFEPGHRVRLALAGADWPNTWPPPSGRRSTSIAARCELVLPVLDGPGELPPPRLAPTTGVDAHAPETDLPQPELVWRFEDDVVERESQGGHVVRLGLRRALRRARLGAVRRCRRRLAGRSRARLGARAGRSTGSRGRWPRCARRRGSTCAPMPTHTTSSSTSWRRSRLMGFRRERRWERSSRGGSPDRQTRMQAARCPGPAPATSCSCGSISRQRASATGSAGGSGSPAAR